MPKPRGKGNRGSNHYYAGLRVTAIGKGVPGKERLERIKRLTLNETVSAEMNRLVEKGVTGKGSMQAVKGLLELGVFAREFDVKASAFQKIGAIGASWRRRGLRAEERENLRHDLVDIAHRQVGVHPAIGSVILKAAEAMTGKAIDPATEGFHPEGKDRPGGHAPMA